jgi:hypothetical protein
MTTTLVEHAVEESTYVITATFRDEDNALIVPTALTWTLTDIHGTVINGRAEVEVVTPASSVDILLYGADLKVQRQSSVERLLTIEATYDSDLEDDLPLKSDVKFIIDGLPAID